LAQGLTLALIVQHFLKTDGQRRLSVTVTLFSLS